MHALSNLVTERVLTVPLALTLTERVLTVPLALTLTERILTVPLALNRIRSRDLAPASACFYARVLQPCPRPAPSPQTPQIPETPPTPQAQDLQAPYPLPLLLT